MYFLGWGLVGCARRERGCTLLPSLQFLEIVCYETIQVNPKFNNNILVLFHSNPIDFSKFKTELWNLFRSFLFSRNCNSLFSAKRSSSTTLSNKWKHRLEWNLTTLPNLPRLSKQTKMSYNLEAGKLVFIFSFLLQLRSEYRTFD